jgi:hypothetical protein
VNRTDPELHATRRSVSSRIGTVLTSVASVPFALIVSAALVVLGPVLATSPATAHHWYGPALGAVSLFVAIVCTGAALRRRRNNRP